MNTNIDIFPMTDPRLAPTGSLEVIVKYSGDILSAIDSLVGVEILNGSFAIITGTAEQINALYDLPFIEFIELPKALTYQLSNSSYAICATRAKGAPYGLTGEGTIIGLIDSGIDFTHPDFLKNDGTTRILSIWDQSAEGTPPEGFLKGREISSQEINLALGSQSPLQALGFRDTEGHGTAVAGAACGNGRQSGGREQGVAPNAAIIAVKLGNRGFGAFARSTEVMRGVKYLLDQARRLNMPISISLSYGTNEGSHDGNSLFEQYMDMAAENGKTTISVAAGNEGNAGHHFSAVLRQGQELEIPFFVSNAPRKIYLTLWKNFSDDMTFRLTSPSNQTSLEIAPAGVGRFILSGVDITYFYGQPTPLSPYQEVYFLLESQDFFIPEGGWTLSVNPKIITDGQIDLWLPTLEDVTNQTFFANPTPEVTLTLPSTAKNVISVGGYDSDTNTFAAFSGMGYTRDIIYVKPDIVAPAVNVLTTRAGGGYMSFSGTSIAAPFVAGGACLLMEWGIVKGNDPFLYGQRLKAFLQKGARRTQNLTYPNNQWGYGALCLSNTLDLLTQYNSGGVFL